jgi:hypothetical protein
LRGKHVEGATEWGRWLIDWLGARRHRFRIGQREKIIYGA